MDLILDSIGQSIDLCLTLNAGLPNEYSGLALVCVNERGRV